MGKIYKIIVGVLVGTLFFMFSLASAAPGQITVFHRDEPQNKKTLAMDSSSSVPAENPSSLTLSFAGDCTLGSTEKMQNYASAFAAFMKGQDYTYPFYHLADLFSKDDFTLINLEGVLSDSKKGQNKNKKYAFRGPSDYVNILTAGSIEGVNLANNHSWDYGKRGMADTIAALDAAQIAPSGEGWLNILTSKGVKVGLGGVVGSLNRDKERALLQEISLLKESSCDIIIYSLHSGQEYSYAHNGLQKKMAHFLINQGVDLVIGHHPHVVQGIEQYERGYIFYSLGNGSFGGNHNPRDFRALVAQITISIDRKNNQKTITPALFPIHISGTQPRNNYQPILLSDRGKAQEVLDLVQEDSLLPIGTFNPNTGALLPVITTPLTSVRPSPLAR